MDQKIAPSAPPAKSAKTAKNRPPAKGRDSRPLYQQVDNIIRKRLIDNVWPPGTALPSEMQLAAELKVSQGTVRKALNDLVAENLLYRRQGLGTFVSEHTERRSLFLYFNLVGNDGSHQLPVSRILTCDYAVASDRERERLQLDPGNEVIRFVRARSFRDEPAIYETVTLPKKLFPRLGADVEIPDHLYRFYQSVYGITVVKAEEHARAVAASAEEARVLRIAAGAPLLEVDRVALTLDSRPVEWRLSRCNTEHCYYLAERG
jgi:GntR family transcriptional regulator